MLHFIEYLINYTNYMFLRVSYSTLLYCNIHKVTYASKAWHKKDLVYWCATNKASLFSETYECIHGFGMANCDPNTRAIDLQTLGPHSCDSPVSKSSGGRRKSTEDQQQVLKFLVVHFIRFCNFIAVMRWLQLLWKIVIFTTSMYHWSWHANC